MLALAAVGCETDGDVDELEDTGTEEPTGEVEEPLEEPITEEPAPDTGDIVDEEEETAE